MLSLQSSLKYEFTISLTYSIFRKFFGNVESHRYSSRNNSEIVCILSIYPHKQPVYLDNRLLMVTPSSVMLKNKYIYQIPFLKYLQKSLKRKYYEFRDLLHFPHVFWQRLVTKEFLSQYFTYKLHFVDMSSQSSWEPVTFSVVEGASVSWAAKTSI